ncbi:TetR/AcrR family transcriptional regulator [Luteimonas sp. BDR2-5]|uniref:TetR/AcrR family transcriptional regulator n=1 Tax=Proluteimonas luteida TaxID=2878685 RepID=UPI001E323901|nr:TetR/AcrR family transcriptional regulator [Luteimonas sp. BDR2-5]MCD9027985.1 TetR/AcrR family transcriptional regulator [Luteimonas sp. BDR2-5]
MAIPKTSARPGPRIRRTQAERREEMRNRILDAAVGELSRKGYAGFRVNEVAQAAQVSKGAQTHHFPTKESLVIAAVQRLYEASYTRSMKLIDALAADGDVFEALMRDSEKFYLGPAFSISVTMLSLGEHEPELRREIQKVSRKHRLPVEAAWLQALLAWGLPEETARTVLYLTQSVFRGMVMRRFLRNDPEYVRFSIAQWRRLARQQIEAVLPAGVRPG